MSLPILITIGDPNGVGPELIVRSLCKKDRVSNPYVIIGPESVIDYYSTIFGIKRFWKYIYKMDRIESLNKGVYLYFEEKNNFSSTPSKPTIEGGVLSKKVLEIAIDLIKQKKASAIVTCPVNKFLVQEAGYKDFMGHTEFFAKRFMLNEDDVCMHLCCSKLRVSLVTTHVPIKEVSDKISVQRIVKSIELTWDFINILCQNPAPIGVCGLNPHAGENGKIGCEEKEIIIPALKYAQEKGIKVEGPYSADTIFFRTLKGEFSAVISMYHDQGLGPLKTICFQECINITLGLPFIRTSVGHGTAYDIAGRGIASLKSFEYALEMAERLIKFKSHGERDG